MAPTDVPLDSAAWAWVGEPPVASEHLGRRCVEVGDTVGTLRGVDVVDGVVEVDLAVEAERCFPGVVWRVDGGGYESFFVRPHQVGNPDAIQYTPAWHGVSSWQLYHGPGFWAPVTFPIDDWFTIRVVFAGRRAEAYVGDLATPVLEIGELRRPVLTGGVGIHGGGAGARVARFAVGDVPGVGFTRPAPPAEPAVPGVVSTWHVSDAFRAVDLGEGATLDDELVAGRAWTRLDAEPAGLADLARVNGLTDGRDTAFARATITSDREQYVPLELGFSDRAVVYLNGLALFRGDDTYRSRDYRFLGSIGWYDTVMLPLRQGVNQLVVAVTEDFGGWGVQARLPDDDGIVVA